MAPFTQETIMALTFLGEDVADVLRLEEDSGAMGNIIMWQHACSLSDPARNPFSLLTGEYVGITPALRRDTWPMEVYVIRNMETMEDYVFYDEFPQDVELHDERDRVGDDDDHDEDVRQHNYQDREGEDGLLSDYDIACSESGYDDDDYDPEDEEPEDGEPEEMIGMHYPYGYEFIDGVGFQDPGGESALRRATPDNPRNQPCPTCKREDMLTPIDVRRGYQCDSCADGYERM
jgi:hypothetical protein